MLNKTTLQDDLADLAREERERLGEAPPVERLLAYRDGRLGEAEAEEIRDRLAVDPEWAALFLDLRDTENRLESSDPKVDVEAAWGAVSSRLQEAPAPLEAPNLETQRRAADRRSYWPAAITGLAAALLLTVDAGWWGHRPEGRRRR